MAAYCLFDVREVTNPGLMDEYRAQVVATVEKHGGRYLVIGGRWETVEGGWRPAFPVMLEFPSLEAARTWYDSPDYAPLKAMRLAATRGDAVFMESLPGV